MSLSKSDLLFLSSILSIFIWLSTPSAHWLDSTEFALSSFSLGVSHPPGQVPYMLFCKLFQWLPFGDIAFRANVFSALCMVGCVPVVASIARKLGGENVWISIVFTLACPIVFTQSIRAEVYALSTLLSLVSINFLLLEDVRSYYCGCFFWGLSFLTHPIIALVPAPFLFRKHNVGIVFSAVAFLLLAYLPLRSMFQHAWNFGNPACFEKLLWFLKGELYPAYGRMTMGQIAIHGKQLLGTLLGQYSIVPCIFAFIGTIFLYRNQKKTLIKMHTGMFLVSYMLVRQANFWPNNPDAQGYFAIVLWCLCLFNMVAVRSLLETKHRWSKIVIFLALVTWGVQSWTQKNYLGSYFSDYLAQNHIEYLMSEPLPSAQVSTSSFVTYSFMKYGEVVEGLRPDVRVIYRGDSTKSPDAIDDRTNRMFELAIDRSHAGKYTLRPLDLLWLKKGFFCDTWFCSSSKLSRSQRETYEVYRNGIQKDAVFRQWYSTEAFLLQDMLSVLAARVKGDTIQEEAAKKDILSLFPDFAEYNELEQYP